MSKEEKNAVAWLKKELPGLVEKGVLPEFTAAALRKHYQMNEEIESPSMMLTVFAVLGATMIGLGLILILAHNWEQISRINRLVLLLGQLFVAQLAVGYAIWRKSEDEAWCEGGGVLLALAFGAALALIGQTYHVAGGRGMLLLLWLLLTLPLAYLLRALAPALLYLSGVMAWLFWLAEGIAERQVTWLLLTFLLPFYWRLLQQGRYEKKTAVFSWALVAAFYASFFMLMQPQIAELDIIIYSELFAVTYLVGRIWFDGEASFFAKAYKAAGLLALTCMALLLTFQEAWHKISWQQVGANEQCMAFFGALLLAFLLWRGRCGFIFGLQPLLVAAALACIEAWGVWAAVLLFNINCLLLGVRGIVQGVKRNSFARLNAGMFLAGMVILLRFFDFNFSYVLRGSVFVGVGFLFLAVNAWLVRRKGRVLK